MRAETTAVAISTAGIWYFSRNLFMNHDKPAIVAVDKSLLFIFTGLFIALLCTKVIRAYFAEKFQLTNDLRAEVAERAKLRNRRFDIQLKNTELQVGLVKTQVELVQTMIKNGGSLMGKTELAELKGYMGILQNIPQASEPASDFIKPYSIAEKEELLGFDWKPILSI